MSISHFLCSCAKMFPFLFSFPFFTISVSPFLLFFVWLPVSYVLNKCMLSACVSPVSPCWSHSLFLAPPTWWSSCTLTAYALLSCTLLCHFCCCSSSFSWLVLNHLVVVAVGLQYILSSLTDRPVLFIRISQHVCHIASPSNIIFSSLSSPVRFISPFSSLFALQQTRQVFRSGCR